MDNKNALLILISCCGVLILAMKTTKFYDFSGTLLISILMIVTPILYLIFFTQDDDKKKKFIVFFLTIYFLIFLSYIFFISENAIVGFVDPHYHIVQYLKLFENFSGVIDFSNSTSISYNFVNLYLITYFLNILTSCDIITIAKIFPPFLNVITCIGVFLITSRLINFKIGVLSMLLFGTEIFVLQFGQEYRTQTLGTVFLFLTLYIILSYFLLKNHKRQNWFVVVLILLMGIVGSSFVSVITSIVVLSSMIILCFLIPVLSKLANILRGYNAFKRIFRTFNDKNPPYCHYISYFFIFFTILFMIYIVYISSNFNSIGDSILKLWTDYFSTVAAEENVVAHVSKPGNFGQLIFGVFVQYAYYIYWGFFAISYLLIVVYSFMKKQWTILIFTASFGSYFIFGIVSSLFGELNVARIYAVGNILVAFSVASFITILSSLLNNKNALETLRILTVVIIIIFSCASLSKFPHYILGNTDPMRGDAPIDTINYWNSNLNEELSNDFITKFNDKYGVVINIDETITPYYFLITSQKYKGPSYEPFFSLVSEHFDASQSDLIYSNPGIQIILRQ